MKEVLLFSGGMDSLIAWEYLNRPDTLYVNLHHRYAREEFSHVRDVLEPTHVVDFPWLGFNCETSSAEIPMRNLYLAMIAANLDYDKIWIVAQKEETSIPDRTPQFMTTTGILLTSLNQRTITVDSPFWDKDKVEMVQWYKDSWKNVERLLDTWACYTPLEGQPCGNCPACFRRFVALKLNGISEPWHQKIYTSEVAKMYLQRVSLRHYSQKRSRDILEALGV